MVQLCHNTALALADILAAIAGERAHAGVLVLAKVASLLQQVRSNTCQDKRPWQQARHCARVYAGTST